MIAAGWGPIGGIAMSMEVMQESGGKVLGVRASGKLSDADYKDVLLPGMKKALDEQGALRLLFYMDDAFSGAEAGAMWDDAKFGATHLADIAKGKFEKIAIVGGSSWERRAGEIFGHLMPGEVKGFAGTELAAAWDWTRS
jgi:hypothetical protein